MPGPFVRDYFLFVLVAALGVLQMVAAHSGLRGLLLLRSRSLAFLVGLAVTAMAFLWFFASEPRNMPDSMGGLDGNQSAGLFAVAAGLAVLITLLAPSVISRPKGAGGRALGPGLEALRETTYLNALDLGALVRRLKELWTRYRR